MIKYLLSILLSGLLWSKDSDSIINKVDLLYLSGIHEEAKLLLIENITKYETQLSKWSLYTFKLGQLVFQEDKFQARLIFLKLLEKNPSYHEKVYRYFPDIDFRNFTKEIFLVHDFAKQNGTLSGAIIITKYTNSNYESCIFALHQRIGIPPTVKNNYTYFSPSELREFLNELITVIQETPSMKSKESGYFERNISNESGFEFNYILKLNSKGKLSVYIKYGKNSPTVEITNVGELKLVITKADAKLKELGY